MYYESVILGRSVYMDFAREPEGIGAHFEGLDPVAYTYLDNSDALIPLPIARLQKMNPGAIALYLEHGIDLTKEPLKVAVCAQHNNGGVRIDANWQTSVRGLYAAGEAAGSLGIFRPGGTALNSSQTGSMRAAEHIVYHSKLTASPRFEEILQRVVAETDELLDATRVVAETDGLLDAVKAGAEADALKGAAKMVAEADVLKDAAKVITEADGVTDVTKAVSEIDELLDGTKPNASTLAAMKQAYSRRMSRSFAFLRDIPAMEREAGAISRDLSAFLEDNKWTEYAEVPMLFKNLDMIRMQQAIAETICYTAKKFGSRGSGFVLSGGDFMDRKPVAEDEQGRGQIVTARKEDGEIILECVPVRPIPTRDLWFERVWNRYRAVTEKMLPDLSV